MAPEIYYNDIFLKVIFLLTLHTNCQPKNVQNIICHSPRYGDIGVLNVCGKITPIDFSKEIHCGNGIFNVPTSMKGVLKILKYFVKSLYFENLKRKIGVLIGKKNNIGRYGKRQRSLAKYGQVMKSQEPSSLKKRLYFDLNIGK